MVLLDKTDNQEMNIIKQQTLSKHHISNIQ